MKKFQFHLLTLLFTFTIFTNVGFPQWLTINPLPQPNSLKDVFALDSANVIAVGYQGTIIKTTNAGTNWGVLNNVGGTNDYLYSVCFADYNTGWCVGYNLILKTTDGGNSWATQQFPTFVITPRFNSVYFIDNSTGWAVGGYSSILKTTNGGNNWIKQYFNGASHYSVFFLDNNIGWMASGEPGLTFSGGYISKTSNSGNNWNRQYYGSSFQDTVMNSIFFADYNTGWTAGFNGKIYKTSNGGTNWFFQNPSTLFSLYSLYFNDVNTGWVVGDAGRIRATTNGGNNWFTQISGTNSSLYSVKFSDDRNGWCVGDFGTILRTTNGGITAINPVSSEIPEQFILSQNYPNPFNPVTNIKFDVPRKSFIKLIIFNSLGQQINELVNQELTAGSYKVDWDAANFPSGVYHYKIQANEFQSIKSMILLK